MQPAKRLEMIADSIELQKLLAGLQKAGISRYTVIHNVEGWGVRGIMASTGDVTMLDTAYVIAFCTPEQVQSTVEILCPILKRFGGSCYVSDVMEVKSNPD
jgi:nitrogen regulatory protein PII